MTRKLVLHIFSEEFQESRKLILKQFSIQKTDIYSFFLLEDKSS